MPPSNQPVRWRIINAVRDLFGTGMTLAGYFHVPKNDNVAVIEPPITQYLGRIDPEVKLLYGVWIEDEIQSGPVESSLGKETLDCPIGIQGCMRFSALQQNPFRFRSEDTDPHEQIRSQLIHDARKLIVSQWPSMGGTNLGGFVDMWRIDTVFPLYSNHFEQPGWVGFDMMTTATHDYRKADPTVT